MSPDAAKVSRQILMPFWKLRTARTAAEAKPSANDLQRRYLTPVLNYVTAHVGSGGAAEAEDITAEVFAAAFAALSRCPPLCATDGARAPAEIPASIDDPVRAWLFGIARRKLADSYRRRTRRPETTLPFGYPAPAGHGPEPRALADEAAKILQQILAQLPFPLMVASLLRKDH